MKSGLFLFFAFMSICSIGQWLPSEFNLDTVRYSFRTGGKLDSLDYSIGRTSGTQPAGSIDLPENVPTVKFFSNFSGGSRQLIDQSRKSLKFSALPHIGFAYTFGTRGTQVAKMNYQQVYSKKFLVNFDITNDRGNGFLRNSNFRLNDVDLAMAKRGEKWAFDLYVRDCVMFSGLSGGVKNDADPDQFPLVFLGVQKINASSNMRSTDLDLVNYFDFQKDSVRAFGLTTRHGLFINGRSYSEEDTLFGLYDLINFDSLVTSDAYQLSRTEHGIGGFMRNTNLFVSARIDGAYWKYYNRGKDHDTLETAVRVQLKYKFGSWLLKNSSSFNLVGAGNEWLTRFELAGRFKKVKLNSFLKIEDRWPDPFQRFYWANNYNYQLGQTIDKQFKLSFENHLRFNINSVDVEVQHSSSFLKDQYYYSTSLGGWSNELYPEIQLHRLGLRADWSYKILTVQPEYAFTFESGLADLIPDHMVKLRTNIKGPIFKSKKMIAFIGAEMIWFSGSKAMSFIPSLDTYIFNGSGATNNGMLNLHAFGGFQIDEFRFFVRFENIGYQWTSSTLEFLDGYPIPSSQLRVGLTWDFFN
jgi:hypothetical protein